MIVIVGETASGKTALAVELAKRFNGEIICADSRTIYRGLSIGTAKPTVQEQAGVPHHLLDIIEPSEHFSAADFKQAALDAIDHIARRGKVPIMVGGSGLYVDAVIFDFTFSDKPDPQERQRLQQLTLDELQAEIVRRGIAMPANPLNPRHLIRTIETAGVAGKRKPLRANTALIGLQVDRDILRQRITKRVNRMVEQGLVAELTTAVQKYGWDAPGLQSTGYKAFRPYIEGTVSLQDAKALFIQNDMQLAKRQRTWFKRNKSIHWISKQAEAVELATTLLNK